MLEVSWYWCGGSHELVPVAMRRSYATSGWMYDMNMSPSRPCALRERSRETAAAALNVFSGLAAGPVVSPAVVVLVEYRMLVAPSMTVLISESMLSAWLNAML